MDKKGFWLRWVGANGLAEAFALGLVGIGATTVVEQALVNPTFLSISAGFLAVSLAGALAGLVLGWAQWTVLRGCLPSIRALSWIAATTVGGVFSWLLAMAPTTVISLMATDGGSPPEIGVAALLSVALAAGAASGAGLSTPQFFALRPHVHRAGWWIGANALAWMLVTPPYLISIEMLAGSTSLPLVLLGVLGAAGVTGAVAGCIHGGVLVRLVARPASDTARPGGGE